METEVIRFVAGETAGEVSAILTYPRDPACLLVLAHGAGGGIRTGFMDGISKALADVGAATFRYNFPYMEKKRKTPDLAPIAVTAVRAAVRCASKKLPGIPIIAAGKSYGGRMTSTAESQEHLPDVKGIVFFGFPLHPPGKPSVERAEHLYKVSIPMLFLPPGK
jgi:predicted alpha/beta-hydrolase family hydrolase